MAGRRVHAVAAACAAAVLAYGLLGPRQRPADIPASRGSPPAVAQDPRLPPSPFGPGPTVTGPDRGLSSAAGVADPGDAGPAAGVAAGRPPAGAQAAAASTPADRTSGAQAPLASASGAAAPAYLASVDRFYRTLWSGADPAQLRSLALQLDGGLPSAVTLGHIPPEDALVLKADLLDVLEPSATLRGELLLQWREGQIARGGTGAEGPRSPADRSREAAIISAWQALPSEDRDAGELDEQLQALRRGGHAEGR